MKNKLTLIFLIISFQLPSSGQSRITGYLKAEENGMPIKYAQVALYLNDTTIATGTITNREGKFQLTNIPKGMFILEFTCVGFQTERITFQYEDRHINIGDFFLKTAYQEIEEVTVQASLSRHVDRLLIYPSTQAAKFAANAIDLLLNLKLPRLWVDPMKNSVEIAGGGKAGFLINGKPAEQAEVRTLSPKEILRVEYIDRPGLRYKDYAVVINYVTKTRESGGIVHAEADHTFVTYGDDLLTAKFNRRQSEAGFDYNFTCLNMDYGYAKRERYAFSDNQITKREWKSDKQAYLYHNHNARLHYSHQEKGKHYFHAAAQLQYFKQPHDNMTAALTAPDTASPTQKTVQDRQTYLMPSVEFYYERNLPGKQLLALNLVGTYTSNESNNHFTNAQGQAILSQGGTDQDGKKWSLIGEGFYEKEGGKLNFSAGIKNTWSRIDNHFRTPEESRTLTKNNAAEAWVELSRSSEKWQNRISAGGYAQYFEENGQSRWNWNYKFLLDLHYALNGNSSIGLHGGFDKNSPTLNETNSTLQQNDTWLWSCGNARLKPWTVGNVQLNYETYGEKFNLQIIGSYSHHFKPAMDEVLRQEGKFIQTTGNQKAMQDLTVMASAMVSLWQDYLTLQIIPMFFHHVSRGNHYTHRLTSWGYTGSLSGNYKNWQLVFQIRNQFKLLFGEYVQLAQITDGLVLSYSHKQWLFSIGTNEFLGRDYKCNEYKQLSASYGYHEYNTAPNGQISLKISYTLPFGRKTESRNQRLNNQDNGDGILKQTL